MAFRGIDNKKGVINMKRGLSLALVLVFILGCVVFTPATPSATAAGDAYQAIEQAVENLNDRVNVLSYKIPFLKTGDSGSSPELSSLLEKLRFTRPDFFYINYKMAYSALSSDGGNTYYVNEITINYNMSKQDIPAAKNYVKNQINTIITSIPNLQNLSKLEQVLAIHDYLAINFNYDDSLKNADIYSMLIERVGVCEAFTGLYTLILKKLGIEVSYSLSTDMKHVWSLVKLDGKWYHVDTTWGNSQTTGRVYHYYFMQSDNAWSTAPGDNLDPHYNWKDEFICNDTTYDNYYWKNVVTPILFSNAGNRYYITSNSIEGKLIKRNGTTETVLLTIPNNWEYVGCYSGLGAHGKYLYYNTPTTIKRYNTEKNTTETFFQIPYTEDGYVYGIHVIANSDKAMIVYEVSKSPKEVGNTYIITDSDNCTLGHTFIDWLLVNPPTETSPGKLRRECIVCDDIVEEPIPSLSSNNGYAYSVVTPPTTTSDGQAKWVHQTYGTFYTVIPKLEGTVVATLKEALSSSLVFNQGIVSGFTVGTKISGYYEGSLNITVYEADGTTVATGKNLATGYVIKLFDNKNNLLDTATVVIMGDVNGDGTISVSDYVAIRLHVLDSSPLAGINLVAANVDGKGGITLVDYIAIRLHILGEVIINQK